MITPLVVGAQVTLGGWAGFAFTDDTRGSTRRGFDAHPWYFYLRAEAGNRWTFFGELEAEHAFKFNGNSGSGALKLERLYIARQFSDQLNVRLGKFFVPFGYWYRLHWHFLTETLSRPFSFNAAATPRFQVGAQAFGRVFSGNTAIRYYGWLGNGPDQNGTNQRSVEAFAYGGSVFVSHDIAGRRDRNIGATLAFHSQTDVVGAVEEIETNLTAGAEANIGRVNVRGEYYAHNREISSDITTYYMAATYWLVPQVAATYRFDGGDDVKRAGSVPDPDARAHSFGVIFRPQATVLLKAEYRINRFSDISVADYNQWNLFMAIKY